MKNWDTLADQAIDLFGGHTPHPETLATIQAAHQRHPEAVERAIDRVAAEYQDGTARSPWGLLKSRVQQLRAPTDTQAQNINTRDKQIARAEQRIRNELLHYDLWDEAEDELFGPRGTLRDHDTPALRTHTRQLWESLRPLGELVEHEQTERLERIRQQKLALSKKTLADKLPTPGNIDPTTVVDGLHVNR